MKTSTSILPRVAAGILPAVAGGIPAAQHPEKRLTKLLNKTLETSL
jgi:hypothetical protein